jgi:hypothetical protein
VFEQFLQKARQGIGYSRATGCNQLVNPRIRYAPSGTAMALVDRNHIVTCHQYKPLNINIAEPASLSKSPALMTSYAPVSAVIVTPVTLRKPAPSCFADPVTPVTDAPDFIAHADQ